MASDPLFSYRLININTIFGYEYKMFLKELEDSAKNVYIKKLRLQKQVRIFFS